MDIAFHEKRGIGKVGGYQLLKMDLMVQIFLVPEPFILL
jgi:hypothetical protein